MLLSAFTLRSRKRCPLSTPIQYYFACPGQQQGNKNESRNNRNFFFFFTKKSLESQITEKATTLLSLEEQCDTKGLHANMYISHMLMTSNSTEHLESKLKSKL